MMTVLSGDDDYGYLISDILGDNYTNAVFIFPSVGISSDMILIAETDDPQSAYDAMESYRLERYEAYMGYAPIEAEKIDKGFVDCCTGYAILAVFSDIETVQELWELAKSGV